MASALEQAAHAAPAAGPQAAANCLWAGAVLGARVGVGCVAALLAGCRERAAQVSGQQLANAVWAAGQLLPGCMEAEHDWQQAQQEQEQQQQGQHAEQQQQQQQGQQQANQERRGSCVAFLQLEVYGLLSACLPLLPSLSGRDWSACLSGCARLQRPPPPSCLDALWHATPAQLPGWGPQALCDALVALAVLRVPPRRQWLAAWMDASAGALPRLGGRQLARLAWALARLGARPSAAWWAAWWGTVGVADLAASPGEAAMVLWATARLGAAPPPRAWAAAALDALAAAAAAAVEAGVVPGGRLGAAPWLQMQHATMALAALGAHALSGPAQLEAAATVDEGGETGVDASGAADVSSALLDCLAAHALAAVQPGRAPLPLADVASAMGTLMELMRACTLADGAAVSPPLRARVTRTAGALAVAATAAMEAGHGGVGRGACDAPAVGRLLVALAQLQEPLGPGALGPSFWVGAAAVAPDAAAAAPDAAAAAPDAAAVPCLPTQAPPRRERRPAHTRAGAVGAGLGAESAAAAPWDELLPRAQLAAAGRGGGGSTAAGRAAQATRAGAWRQRQRFWGGVEATLAKGAAALDPGGASNALWALARLKRRPPPATAAALLAAVGGRLRALTPAQLARALLAAGRLGLCPSTTWLHAAGSQAYCQLSALDAHQLAAVLEGLARCIGGDGALPPELVRDWCREAGPRLGEMRGAELAAVAAALLRCGGAPDAAWLQRLHAAAGPQRLAGMAAPQLLRLLSALVRLRAPPPSPAWVADLVAAAVADGAELQPHHAGWMALLLTRWGQGLAPDQLAALLAAAAPRLPTASPDQAARSVLMLAAARCRPPTQWLDAAVVAVAGVSDVRGAPAAPLRSARRLLRALLCMCYAPGSPRAAAALSALSQAVRRPPPPSRRLPPGGGTGHGPGPVLAAGPVPA